MISVSPVDFHYLNLPFNILMGRIVAEDNQLIEMYAELPQE